MGYLKNKISTTKTQKPFAQQRSNALHHYPQKLTRELRRERAVFVPGCPFFVLFWTSKKEQAGCDEYKAMSTIKCTYKELS